MPYYEKVNNRLSLIPLGQEIGRGKEGVIYDVRGRNEIVAKVYPNVDDRRRRSQKLRAMISNPPAELYDIVSSKHGQERIPRFAWPLSELCDRQGGFCGFTMPKVNISQSLPIGTIQNPSTRKEIDWADRIRLRGLAKISFNLASRINALHNIGCVIADFNQFNILVSESLLVTVIDCDSFQLTVNRTLYTSDVFSANHRAPEFTGDMINLPRSVQSDSFALAVHIYNLLLGAHPFRNGIWEDGTVEKPSAFQCSINGEWRGKPGGKLKIEPGKPGIDEILTEEVIQAFHNAFSNGPTYMNRRPSSEMWMRILREFIYGRTHSNFARR